MTGRLRTPSARSPSARVALTLEEVSRLLAAVEPLKARVLLTTMYGCGLRCPKPCDSRFATSTVSGW